MVITPGDQALEILDIQETKMSQLLGWMQEQDLQPEIVSFCDPSVSWLDYSLIIPTPGLVYLDFYQPVMQWIEMLERLGAPLHNPGHILKWNSSKTYLVELQDRGVALPKTVIVPKGSSEEEMKELIEGSGLQGKEVVVKPLIGADGVRTTRLPAGQGVNRPVEEDMLVQEYVAELSTRGEYSLLFFQGEFSHAVRKTNSTGDFRIQSRYGGQYQFVDITQSAELASLLDFGQSVLSLACLPPDLLYARVDLALARDSGDQLSPVLMELELLEPALYTADNPQAGANFARAARRRVDMELANRAAGPKTGGKVG